MANALITAYRQNLAAQGLTDDTPDDYLISKWVADDPTLLQQYPDLAQEWGAIREANAPSLIGEGGRAIKAGTEELGATALGLGALATGSDYLKQKARDVERAAAENAPTIPTMEDIAPGETGTLRRLLSKDALRYGIAKAAGAVPALAEGIGLGAAGAAIGSAIGPEGTLAGAGEGALEGFLGRGIVKSAIRKLLNDGVISGTETGVADAIRAGSTDLLDAVTKQATAMAAQRGGTVANVANMYGLNAGNLYNETGDRETSAIGGAVGALPAIALPEIVIRKLYPGVAREVGEQLGNKYVTRLATEALKDSGIMGSAMGLQEAANIVVKNIAAGAQDPANFSDADWKRVREAAVGGALSGPFAAPLTALHNAQSFGGESGAGAPSLRQSAASDALSGQPPPVPEPTAQPEVAPEARPVVPSLTRQVALMTDDAQKQAVFDDLSTRKAGGETLTEDQNSALDILQAEGFEPTAKPEAAAPVEQPVAVPARPEDVASAAVGDTGVAIGTETPEVTTPAAVVPREGEAALPIPSRPVENEPQILPPAREGAAPAEPERISSAAVRTNDGTIYTGKWHPAAYEEYMQESGKTKEQVIAELNGGQIEDGFLTNTGRFVSRDDAAKIAENADQFKPGKEGDVAFAGALKGMEKGPGVVRSEQAPTPESDFARYQELQRQMAEMGADGMGTPEFQAIWQESEQIKNRNKGMPPEPPREVAPITAPTVEIPAAEVRPVEAALPIEAITPEPAPAEAPVAPEAAIPPTEPLGVTPAVAPTLEESLRSALAAKPEPFKFGPVAEGPENVVDYRTDPRFSELKPTQWDQVVSEVTGLREGEQPNSSRTRQAIVLRGPEGEIVQAGLLPPRATKTATGTSETGYRLQRMGRQRDVAKGTGVRVEIEPGAKSPALLREVVASGYTPIARLTFREEPGRIFETFKNEAAYDAAAEASGVARAPEALRPAEAPTVKPEERMAEIEQEAQLLEEQARQALPEEAAKIDNQLETLANEYRQLGGEPKFMAEQVPSKPPVSIEADQARRFAAVVGNLRQAGAQVDTFTKAFFTANLTDYLRTRLDDLIDQYQRAPEHMQEDLQPAIEDIQKQIAAAEKVRGITYNPNHLALAMDDVQNANVADLVVLLHEAGHVALGRSTLAQQSAVMRAVDSAFSELRAKLTESQKVTGVRERISGNHEELLVSTIAQKLAVEGVPDAPSLARAIWQWVKDLYYRTAMGVQAAFGRTPDTKLALDWFENQVRRLTGGDYDYRFASLTDRYSPETMTARSSRVRPMRGHANAIVDRYDPFTDRVRQPDVLDNTSEGVDWNFKFMTDAGENPGKEEDIPSTEAYARIRAAAVAEEGDLAEKSYADYVASLPENAPKLGFDEWWTLVAGSRETPKLRLADFEQKVKGSGSARIGGERMTKMMNDGGLLRAKELFRTWDRSAANKIATSIESQADAEKNLTDVAKRINRIESDFRNADMHAATFVDRFDELVRDMRKGVRRGVDAVHVGPLAAAIRRAEGLTQRDAIPQEYLRVFKQVRDGEIPIFDYMQAIAKLDLPLADMTVPEVIKAVQSEAATSPELARLTEPRNKALFIALSTLAQRSADQMDLVKLRLSDAKSYLALKPELEAIKRASQDELMAMAKTFKEGSRAAVYADRIKQRMVAQRLKLRRLQTTIREAEERRGALQQLRQAISARLEQIETGGLPQESEWMPHNGAVFPAMYQDEAGRWRSRERTLAFNTDGTAVDPAQLATDLAWNRRYLEENKDKAGSKNYQLVQKSFNELSTIDAQQKHLEMNYWKLEKLFLPVADQLAAGGGAGAYAARRMLNRFQFILFRNWHKEIEIPAIKWTAAASAAMKAASYTDQRAFLDDVYDPALYHLGVNPGLDEGPALREAVRAARRRLTTEPTKDFDEAFKAFMRQTKAISERFVKIAEDNGIFVADDKLGGELRRAVARGFLTVIRRMDQATVTTALRDMDAAGWKLEFRDKEGATTTRPFDEGVSKKERVVAASTFDKLFPWTTSDEEQAKARTETLENPEAFAQAINPQFTPGIIRRFLAPYINKPGEPIFGYRGEPIDQLDAQQAWQDAGGNVAKWIDLLGERVGLSHETMTLDGEEIPQIELESDLSPQAEWRTIMLRKIDDLYKMTAGMGADANQVTNLFDSGGRPPLVLMTDRENDLLPAEFVQHAAFGRDDAHQLLATLAFHAAFGRNGEAMVRAIDEMKSNLKARKAQFDMLASARSRKADRIALAKELGIDYTEAKKAAEIYRDVENGLQVLKAQFNFGNAAGVLGQVRGGLALVHFMASQITNQPKTALLNMLQPAQRALVRRSIGPVMIRDTARAFGGTAHTLLGQFLESFGLHLMASSQHDKEIAAIQGAGFGKLTGSELLGMGIGRRGEERSTLGKIGAVIQGVQRRGGFGSPKEFPRAPNIPVATNVMHGLGLDVAIANGAAEVRSVESLIQAASDYFAAHPEDARNPTFRLTNKNLNRAWNWDANSFDYMRQALAENGFGSLENMVRRAMERQTKGQPLLTNEEVGKIAMISNNDLDLMSSINTRPGWWAQNPVMKFFTPLIGWPVAQMWKVHDAMRTAEGRGSMVQAMKTIGILAAWSLPVGLAFTFLTDYYDEKVLKKKTNFPSLSPVAAIPFVGPVLALATSDLDPMQQLSSMGQRLSRAGNIYGLGADMIAQSLAGLDPTSGQRPFSLDGRVLMFSQLLQVSQALNSWIQSGFTTTYANVERPLIQALGGNGAIQAIDTFNAALGLDNQEARIVMKTNASQWIRVAARDTGLELRRSGGGSVAPTPVSVWIREMQLAAMANDRMGFLDAYRNAVSASREQGDPNPEAKVLEGWKSRDPLDVLRTRPDDTQMRKLFGAMDDQGEAAVREALMLYNRFTDMIAPSAQETRMNRMQGAMRSQYTRYSADNLRRRFSSLALSQ